MLLLTLFSVAAAVIQPRQLRGSDVALSPDGKHVAGVTGVGRLWSGGKTIRSWEASTGKPVWSATASGMTCVTYVADGTFVVTGSDDGMLRVWNAGQGTLQRAWKGNSGAVRSVVAMPRRHSFVSAAEDGCVQMSDADTGRRLVRYATE
jgi:eukaryotic-like serine/threonine-protein kinase